MAVWCRPYVVLATSNCLETGFAQDLFLEFSSSPKHLIVFTHRTPRGTLAHTLMQSPTPAVVAVKQWVNVALQGAELEQWREAQRIAAEQERLEKKKELENEDSDAEQEEGGAGGGGGGGGAGGSGAGAGAAADGGGEDSAMGDAAPKAAKGIKLTASFPMYVLCVVSVGG
jgi:hypothetical protein